MNNGNNTHKIIVGNCVDCDGLVRIPASASPDSVVRCPHCGANFQLSTVLDRSLPPLEVVDQPKSNSSPTASPAAKPYVPTGTSFATGGKIVGDAVDGGMPGRINLDSSGQSPERQPGSRFEVSPILKKGAKKKKRRRSRSGSSSGSSSSRSSSSGSSRSSKGNGFQIQVESKVPEPAVTGSNGAAAVDVVPSPEQRRTSNGAERTREKSERPRDRSGQSRRNRPPAKRKSKSSSGGGEIFKVLIGAMFALPVAQLLVWWAFNKDPLHLGPAVSNVIPAVVPADFRTPSVDDEEDDGTMQPFDPLSDPDANAGGDELPLPQSRTQLDRIGPTEEQ